MNKVELASYLVSLQTLLDAQFKSVHTPSDMLSREYEKHWKMLKDELQKETEE